MDSALSFAHWLKGYAELTKDAHPDAAQWRVIQDRLKQVVGPIDPTLPSPTTGGHNTTNVWPSYHWNGGVPTISNYLYT